MYLSRDKDHQPNLSSVSEKTEFTAFSVVELKQQSLHSLVTVITRSWAVAASADHTASDVWYSYTLE